MAWPSSETKMDTGQLYVSSDNGETYTPIDMHPITECKVEIKTTVKNSACKMLEQERTYKAILNGEFDIFPKVIWDAWMCFIEAAVKREMYRIPEFKIGTVDFRKLYHELWVLTGGVGGFCYAKPPYPVEKSIREKAEAEAEWKPFHEVFEEDINKEKENKTMERKPEARKCERCGKLFEVSFEDGYCDVTNATEIINKTIKLTNYEKDQYSEDGQNRRRTERIRIHNDNSDDLKESTVVLCHECRESLKQWWENPDKILVDPTPISEEAES